jgi:hypothetical protein
MAREALDLPAKPALRLLPTPCWFRPELPCNPCILSQKAHRLSPIIAKSVHSRPKNRVDSRALCHPPLFFIDIVGSIFIFNIFMDQRPVSDPEEHIREPPQLAQAEIFHPLHEQGIFVLRSGVDPL